MSIFLSKSEFIYLFIFLIEKNLKLLYDLHLFLKVFIATYKEIDF